MGSSLICCVPSVAASREPHPRAAGIAACPFSDLGSVFLHGWMCDAGIEVRRKHSHPGQISLPMKIDRRELVVGAAAAALGRTGPGREPQPAPARRPKLLIGYGVVNLWHTIDAAELAARLFEARCTLTEIEYVAWFNAEAREGRSIETRPEAAKRFVEAMRARRVWTFISLVNWSGAAQRH